MAQEAKKPKIKRRQYIVPGKYQYKYVGLILLFMFLTAALCSYVVYYTSIVQLGPKLAKVYPQDQLKYIVDKVNFRILWSVIFVTPLAALIGIFLSHKIAGPIKRMERFIDNMASGDLGSNLVLRKGDELTGLADRINYLAKSLRASAAGQKERLDAISEAIGDLKKTAASRPNEFSGIVDGVNRLYNEVEGLKKELGRYRM